MGSLLVACRLVGLLISCGLLGPLLVAGRLMGLLVARRLRSIRLACGLACGLALRLLSTVMLGSRAVLFGDVEEMIGVRPLGWT